MNIWFWMNKVVRIGTNQGTLLVWILDFCCLDHDDVYWDDSKGESSGKQEEREAKMKHKVLKKNRKS